MTGYGTVTRLPCPLCIGQHRLLMSGGNTCRLNATFPQNWSLSTDPVEIAVDIELQQRRRMIQRPAPVPREQRRQIPTHPNRVHRQKCQLPGPDYPRRSSPPSNPEAACSARDPPPQRTASSDPPQQRRNQRATESLTKFAFTQLGLKRQSERTSAVSALHPFATMSVRAPSAGLGHVWTAPAVQEELDFCEAFGCSHVGMDGPTSPGCRLITRSGGDLDNGGGI